MGEEGVGLSTKDGLNRLCKEIDQTVKHYKLSHKHRKTKSWLFYSLHHTSLYTSINWISGTILFTCSLNILVASFSSEDYIYLINESIFLQILLILSIILELFDNKLRHEEVTTRIQRLVTEIKKEMNNIKWESNNYPSLSIPFSPCITLQWTYRDNKLVNLPWALLVKDDIIIIRPGQNSPGYCEAIDKSSDFPLLHFREVYSPSLQSGNEIFSMPKMRKPLENKKYRLLETPYLNNLKIALESALDRPVTPHNKQRHLVMVRIIERFLLPVLIVLIYCINCVRYFYLENSIGKASQVDIFLLVPTATILPLLPVMFPIFWIGLNYLGMARFTSIFDESMTIPESLDLEEQENKIENFYSFKFNLKLLWIDFCDIFLGRTVHILPRTANILHVFGSVTALCCIDKKGILSWPNPTAEKVFFLHNNDNLSETSSLANLNDLHYDEDNFKNSDEDMHKKEDEQDHTAATGEVLDVTYNPNDPFKLHFDDTKWKKYLNSLKPLGLAILLNTCNVNTQDNYSQFCTHITCEAMYNENLVPVTNRRCLCELAKEIGFLEQAHKIFSLEQQLSTFRHLQPEMVRRDNKYARSLSMSTKLKFPFPHMFAVVVKELSSGSMQLLAQGTADIILDSCVDYWDGFDLCPLSPTDRKKVQDFYQRSSLTAYCTAFAYRPLSKAVNAKLSKVYLELPSDSRHLYQCHRSPTPLHWDCRSVLEPKIRTPLGPFYSTDSLLYNDTPSSEVADADSCFDMQCNQVLIGLVTMQYQAQSDMVYLIEQLERACIRFVHFSKENELRSRVFSEKMGLESGWNCHISLLSDRNSNLQSSRTMSFSAPSAINMEHTVVKFDTENCPLLDKSTRNNTQIKEGDDEDKGSKESFPTDLNKDTHDWQSLSCITDSTEHSAPINFDMSNRAKLPRGIDKIRPHIELIDNVPLLVSLFTDCTSSSTKEMLHIMQDYGEVVCVMGSSANNENIGIFMQADASIAIEPVYPQVCQKSESYKANSDKFHPVELSRALNSVACSLSLKRENPISIFRLVMEARHYMACLWNSTQFWLSCCLCLTILQFTAALFMLPPILTIGQVIWIICIVIPLLSISLIATRTDPDIMKKPQEKNQIIFNTEVATFVLWCYGSKLLPVIFFVVISFAGMLAMLCIDICGKQNCTCVLFYLPIERQNVSFIAGWTNSEHGHTLYFTQNIILIVIFLHFVAISISFVHREHNIWIRCPFSNLLWVFVVMLLFLIQTLFSLISILQINDLKSIELNPIILTFAFVSPFITFGINELVKREEIKVNLRQQRRIRLEFGTKLGMNSPF